MPQWVIVVTIIVLIGIVWWLYRKSGSISFRTTILDLYSKDLTRLARDGKLDPVIGRKHELQRAIEILTRRTKNNPVLIGKSGVGKTAIVEELANEIAKGTVPDVLKDKRVLALDLSGLVAGTKYRGEFEKRLKALVDEIIAAERHIILFIDELHSLAEAGEATGAINAADILKPALARGELQVVGATTVEDYEKYVRNDQTLERRFQPVLVEEPTPESSLEILNGIKTRYEDYHNVRYTEEALQTAVRLSVEKIHDRVLPDKAIDLIDEAGSRVRIRADEQRLPHENRPEVTGKDIEAIVEEWASVHLPPTKPAPQASAAS